MQHLVAVCLRCRHRLSHSQSDTPASGNTAMSAVRGGTVRVDDVPVCARAHTYRQTCPPPPTWRNIEEGTKVFENTIVEVVQVSSVGGRYAHARVVRPCIDRHSSKCNAEVVCVVRAACVRRVGRWMRRTHLGAQIWKGARRVHPEHVAVEPQQPARCLRRQRSPDQPGNTSC